MGWKSVVASIAAAPLLIASLPAQPAQAVDASALVAHWSFENALTDASGKGHDATLGTTIGAASSVATYADGVSGKAFVFNGSTALNLGTSRDLQPADLSFSFWVKPTGTMSGEQVFAWNKVAYNNEGWYLSSTATTPLVLSIGPDTKSSNPQPYLVTTTSARATFFPADTWTHVAVTYDHTTKAVAFYRNGVKVTTAITQAITATATGVLGQTDDVKTLGYNGPSYKGSFLKGALDEVKLYSSVISEDEVATAFDAAKLAAPTSVTSGFSLATIGDAGSTVNWTSSDPTHLAVSGSTATVTRPAPGQADAKVTLTASVAKGSATAVERTFEVNVTAIPLVLSQSVTVSSPVSGVKVGDTANLTASVAPADTTDKTVAWSSSNESIASVDANGVVTAVAPGEVTITATATDAGAAHGSVTLAVTSATVLSQSVTVSAPVAELGVGRTATLSAAVLPADTTVKTVTWSSSDASIATVSASGVVTAVAPGEVTIKATATDDGAASGTAKLTVVPVLVDSVALTAPVVGLGVGAKTRLVPVVAPADATDKTLDWSSSDESIATVSASGVVTGVATGEVTITAKAADAGHAKGTLKARVVKAAVAHWNFENALTDVTENGHDASVGSTRTGATSSVAIYADGVTGKAFNFNGSTALDLGVAKTLQPADLSFSFWYKPNGAMTGEQVFSWNKAEYNTDGWYLASESDTMPLALSIGPSTGQPYKVAVKTATASRATFFPADTWTHIAVTYDHDTKAVAMYRNGVKVVTTVTNAISSTATGVLGQTDGVKTLGYNGPVYKYSFLKGAMDEVKLYDQAITARDVVIDYQLVRADFDPATVAQADADALSISGTAIADFTLLKAGASGSAISWTSSDPASIKVDGDTAKVTRPAAGSADAKVTLTAAVAYAGSAPVTRAFEVTVTAMPVVLSQNVTVSSPVGSVKVGETANLSATVLPADTTVKTVTWSSSDDAVATVDADGVVTGVAPGDVTITAKATDAGAASGSVSLSVTTATVLAESVTVNSPVTDLGVGRTTTLAATVLPANSTLKTVTWSSSDEAKAKVSAAGVVTAVAPGEVTITATATDASGVKGSVKLNVVKTAVAHWSFENALTDVTGNGHDASVGSTRTGATGSVAVYADGVAGKAFEFNGSTALDLGVAKDLQPADLTFSFWFKPTGTMSGEQVFAWNKAAYNSDGWYLASEDDSTPLSLSVGPATSQPYKVAVKSTRSTFFPAGTWTHVVVTYDHATKAVTFYRNGLKVASSVSYAASGDATGVLGQTDGVKTLGYNGPNYKFSYLKGALDEVKINDTVASQRDVVAEYQLVHPEFDTAAVATSDANALTVAGSATANFTLPTAGASGSTVSWASSDADHIAVNGGAATVTRPASGAADVTVTLTASVAFAGSDPVTRTFEVIVLAKTDSSSSALLLPSGMAKVELIDDYLSNAAKQDIAYLLEFDTGRLLYEFRRVSGVTQTAAGNYGGWEAGPSRNGDASASNPTRFTGHFVGHYLSAISEAYASTTATAAQKEQLLTKIKELVVGLRETQTKYATANPSNAGYLPAFEVNLLPSGGSGLLVPFYNLHKVLQGLVEAYHDIPAGTMYNGVDVWEAALASAGDFGSFLNSWYTASGKTKAQILATEYGGMNDALYQLYEITGNAQHKQAAELFDETTLFDSLAANSDVLAGKHANTTIPKVIGALRRYVVFTEHPEYYATLTQAEKDALPNYLAAAKNFWQIVVDHHSYANGANSQSEHFHESDSLWKYATQTGTGNSGYAANSTAETCNEFNLLKLTRLLLQVTKQPKYSEFYEHTFRNTILAQQNPETGMVTYFQPMQAGYSKVFSIRGTSTFTGSERGEFWCDQGTGVENFAKLSDSLYFTDGNDVYVSMFYASSFDYAKNNLRLVQTGDIPKQDTVTYRVTGLDGGAVASGTKLKLRVPDWAASTPTLQKNGQTVQLNTDANGWATVSVAAGDTITYQLPAKVKLIETADNPNWVAFQYGPVLLAAAVGDNNVGGWYYAGVLVRMATFDADAAAKAEVLVTGASATAEQWKQNIGSNLVRTDSPTDAAELTFALKDADGKTTDLVFTPYYSMYKHRYAVYITLAGLDSAAYQKSLVTGKQQLREAMRTVDSLTSFDNNNSEADKNYTFDNSTVGVLDGASFRTAGKSGWFAYDMVVKKSVTNYLGVKYAKADAGNSFDIMVAGQKLKTVTITNPSGSDAYYTEYYQLPSDLVAAAGRKLDNAQNPVVDGDGKPVYALPVKFVGNGSTDVGRVFGVSVVTKTAFDTNANLSALSFKSGTLRSAFSPYVRSYVLDVPADATSVDANLWPALPKGAAAGATTAAYVKVNGIVVDEKLTRTIKLTGNTTTVNIASYAEDHQTVNWYSVLIVKAGTTVSDAPILRYTFDNDSSVAAGATVADSGTRKLNGVVVNANASLKPGKDGGQALSLPGGSASSTAPYVRIPTGLITSSQEDVTLTARIRWNDTAKANYQWPFTLGQSNTQYVFATPAGGGSSYAEVKSGGATVTLRHSATLPVGEWHDLAVVLEGGSSLTYYLDGVPVASATTTVKASGVIGNSSLSGYLGKSFYSDPYFNGDLDDVAVYDRALSTLELSGYVAVPVTGVTVSAPATTVDVGATLALTAKIAPESASVKDVVWSTSDAAIAKVDADGLVTAVAPGEVTITATAADGSEAKGTIQVTVLAAPSPTPTEPTPTPTPTEPTPTPTEPTPTPTEPTPTTPVPTTPAPTTPVPTAPANPIPTTSVPKVSGKAKVGVKLKADAGKWGPSPVKLTYQWFRGDAAIGGATSVTYKVRTVDGGAKLSVRVTGSKAGYDSVTRASAATKAVPLSKLKVGKVSVKGKAVVGRTLTVSPGKWTPGTTLTYRWYRSGSLIQGATGRSYSLTASDLGRKVKAVVTGTKPGYRAAAKSSKYTAKIK